MATVVASSIRSFSEIPGPRGWPFIGSLLDYRFGPYKLENYHLALKDLHRRFGRIVKQNLGTQTVVHVFHPEDIQKVYQAEDKTPTIAPLLITNLFYRKLRDYSPGLGNTNGEEWYRLRQAIQRMMLRPNEVYYYLPLADSVACDFVKVLKDVRNEENKQVDQLEMHVKKWNLESAGTVCFDTRLGFMAGGKNENVAEQMIQSNRQTFYLSGCLKFSLPLYQYFATPKWKKLVEAEDLYYSHVMRIFNGAISRLEEAQREGTLQDGRFNFLAYLLSRKELSRKDVITLTFSLFSDGLTTTAPAVLHNLYCLASNPEIQQRLYEEIETVLPNGEPITVDKLEEMHYLRSCIKETFRFFPTGTEIVRKIKKDLVLSGFLIPAGTQLDLNQFVYFESDEFFDQPEVYLPDRWLRSNPSKKQVHPYLLIPFGHGVRTCAGRRYAEQDLKVLLCRILQKFRLEWHQPPLKQKYEILLFPDQPVRVAFVDRK